MAVGTNPHPHHRLRPPPSSCRSDLSAGRGTRPEPCTVARRYRDLDKDALPGVLSPEDHGRGTDGRAGWSGSARRRAFVRGVLRGGAGPPSQDPLDGDGESPGGRGRRAGRLHPGVGSMGRGRRDGESGRIPPPERDEHLPQSLPEGDARAPEGRRAAPENEPRSVAWTTVCRSHRRWTRSPLASGRPWSSPRSSAIHPKRQVGCSAWGPRPCAHSHMQDGPPFALPRSSPMIEYRDVLERQLDLLAPPRIPIDRLSRRRDRKRRNQRITAGIVAVAISVLAITGLIRAFSAPPETGTSPDAHTGGRVGDGGHDAPECRHRRGNSFVRRDRVDPGRAWVPGFTGRNVVRVRRLPTGRRAYFPSPALRSGRRWHHRPKDHGGSGHRGRAPTVVTGWLTDRVRGEHGCVRGYLRRRCGQWGDHAADAWSRPDPALRRSTHAKLHFRRSSDHLHEGGRQLGRPAGRSLFQAGRPPAYSETRHWARIPRTGHGLPTATRWQMVPSSAWVGSMSRAPTGAARSSTLTGYRWAVPVSGMSPGWMHRSRCGRRMARGSSHWTTTRDTALLLSA